MPNEPLTRNALECAAHALLTHVHMYVCTRTESGNACGKSYSWGIGELCIL